MSFEEFIMRTTPGGKFNLLMLGHYEFNLTKALERIKLDQEALKKRARKKYSNRKKGSNDEQR